MAVQIQLRRGTAASWTAANPTLANGEIGIESDTNYFKIGTGVTAWTNLSYGGLQGTNGQGVPVGGSVGQVLYKNSGTNYDTSWVSMHDSDQTILSSQIFG